MSILEGRAIEFFFVGILIPLSGLVFYLITVSGF
jgi:hypothetical protein